MLNLCKCIGNAIKYAQRRSQEAYEASMDNFYGVINDKLKNGGKLMEVNEYKLRKLMDHVLPVITCDACPAMGSCEYIDDEPYEYSCVDLIIQAISEDNK